MTAARLATSRSAPPTLGRARDPALPRQEDLSRRPPRAGRHHPARRQGRVHLAHRPFRRRQEHALAAPLLRREAHQRADPDRRQEHRTDQPGRSSVPAAQHRGRLPGFQAARQPDRARERGVCARGARRLRRGHPRARPQAPRSRASLAQRGQPAAAALRRRAAARGHRSRAGERAHHPARGRAHRKPRSVADRQHPAAPLRRKRAGHHRGRGHPRPRLAPAVAPPDRRPRARKAGLRRMIAHVAWRLSRRAAVNLWGGLPASVETRPRARLAAPSLRVLAGELEQLPGVRDVEYGREWLDKLEALGRGLRAFGAGALLAVLGAALMVVANTIRLAVYARRDEIEIMKLVGATDGYVRAPFLMEGALQGVLGAGVAVGVVLAAQYWLLPHATQAFAVAAGVGAPHLLPAHAAALLAAGALVGFVGSWIAVARFLKT